jgi:hypothetical protein
MINKIIKDGHSYTFTHEGEPMAVIAPNLDKIV